MINSIREARYLTEVDTHELECVKEGRGEVGKREGGRTVKTPLLLLTTSE